MTPEEKRKYGREYMRQWRKDNPRPLTPEQRMKARVREAAWRARNPGRKTPYDPSYKLRHPWARSLGPRQAHAKKHGIPFTLRVPDAKAVWTGRCAVTGLPFDLRVGRGNGPRPFSPSLDRLRPKAGYVPGNIRFVLHCVNSFKGAMTDRLMVRVAEVISRRGTLLLDRTQVDKERSPARGR